MTFYVNNEEYLLASGWNIGDKIGNPAPSYFTVLVQEGQETPKSGDVVSLIGDNSEALFFGIIAIPTSVGFSSPDQSKIYELKCTNANTIAKRRIANVSYSNKTIAEIVNNLYTLYLAPENVTKGDITTLTVPFFEVYNCKNMNLMSVLNELVGYLNGAWRITNEKVFEFIDFSEFPHASQAVNADNAPFENLKISDNSNDVRTTQIVDGAYLTTDPQTESTVVTEDWYGFETQFPIIQQPSMKINGTDVPDSEIGVRGIDDAAPNILFYWSNESTQISVNRYYSGSTSLNEGDTVTIIYVGIVPIRYEVSNTSKIDELAQRTGLSGIIENLYFDKTIVTRQDALNKANALLDLYDERRTTITCTTDIHTLEDAGFLLSDTELYKEWTFNIPTLDLVGEYVVVERTVYPFRLNDDESVKIKLTFADRDFAQGYGMIISRISQDITKLSVRAEETVIQDVYINEVLGLSEVLETGETMPLWVANSLENGQIAQPLGTIMPNLVTGGNDWRDRWTVFATDTDTGVVCSPYLGADQYACVL